MDKSRERVGLPGERALLARLKRQAERYSVPSSVLRLGIGDDCAILRPPSGHEIVVTTDLFLEQVHFRRDWHQPEVAGHRCLARGLSDIAAMGANPVAAFLSFALPPELAGGWVERFLSGLLRLAKRHGVSLAGGDTAEAPGQASGHRRSAGALFSADIVLFGTVPRGKALLRSGARVGDAIYVTGTLGGAAAELLLIEREPGAYKHLLQARKGHPHLFPAPRLEVGAFLLGRATSAIDVSDGLSTDLAHLCDESGVGAEIDASLLPIDPTALRADLPSSPQSLALHGGEDYELLFTAPPRRRLPKMIARTPIHRIGHVVASRRGQPHVILIEPEGTRRPLLNQGWEHLR